MGTYSSCTDWDYEDHPQYSEMVARSDFIGRLLERCPERVERYRLSTRAGHSFLFREMAPAACSCLVGNFRGTQGCPHLTGYAVYTGDPMVGAGPAGKQLSPAWVPIHMKTFEADCQASVVSYANWVTGSGATLSAGKRLLKLIEIVATLLENFLTIHPFANGNGHTGRLLVAVILSKFGFKRGGWPLEESPMYGQALSDHRRGMPKPLQQFILNAVLNKAPVPVRADPPKP